MYEEDMLAVQGEEQAGEPLLVDVITDGEIVYDMPSLDVVQERAQDERRSLPRAVRNITDPASYPVRISERLQTTTERVQDELRRERT